MTAPSTVARFDLWYDPVMEARFAREPGIMLRTIALSGPEADSWATLGAARAYQISAARDELPRQWWAEAPLLVRCPNLLCVSSAGVGFDTVDVAACTRAGVLVVNQAGANAQAVAEHTLGLMLDLSKRISESDRKLRVERGFSRETLMGSEIGGKVLGLVGIGDIGRRVARFAAAFGMRVLATDPLLDPAEIARRGAEPVGLDALLAQSDYVSLHCPRNAETMGMIGAAQFARMKQGAFFITTARGGIHDEAALAAALARGHLGGAGLDVWSVEPPPLDHALLALPNVVATFHTAGVTHEARRNVALSAAEQVIAVLRGERPPHLVNPEAWDAYVERFRNAPPVPAAAS